MPVYLSKKFGKVILSIVLGLFVIIPGCGVRATFQEAIREEPKAETPEGNVLSDYYLKFYNQIAGFHRKKKGTTKIIALDLLPKDAYGRVNWTGAVLEGYINPRGSLDPDAEEEPPLDLNNFIEAKVPLMANVIFPHSIHTYWLSCKNCHPGIFIAEAGMNPISMDEIFDGKWCGRCHGKVAFDFWPMSNCRRCHIVPKGRSMEPERWR